MNTNLSPPTGAKTPGGTAASCRESRPQGATNGTAAAPRRESRPQGASGARAASTAHDVVSCISALVVDGGTAFSIEVPGSKWSRPLKDVCARTPPGARARAEVLGPSGAEARVSASRPGVVDAYFPHRAHVRLDLPGGRVRVQARATELWAHGVAAWQQTWLGWLTVLLRGSTSAHYGDAGWQTSALELCSDFVGLDLREADADSFTQRAKITSTRGPNGVETISVGSRETAWSLNIENKTLQLHRRFGLAPEASIYAPTWSNSPAFDRGAIVTRVELRLNSRGMRDLAKEVGPKATAPSLLIDRDALSDLWRRRLGARRLVASASPRRRRAQVDPRWDAVIEAAGPAVAIERGHEVFAISRDESLRRAGRRVLRSAQAYAAIIGATCVDAAELERAAVDALRAALCSDQASHAAYAERMRVRFASLAGEPGA